MNTKDIRNIEKCGTTASSCRCMSTTKSLDMTSCCGSPATVGGGKIDEKVPGFLGWMSTAAGRVPRVATKLTLGDHLGACKARWKISRMNYLVASGLYAVGNPSADDPVVVTANYKMTYDIIRRTLAGRNVWILVLESFGVNVWCAAGKGTFGTEELVRRITATGLAMIVNHRRLLLPILGAPGVAAHEVTQRTGFSITYSTIRAEDLPEFLDNGMVTTSAMREMTFSFYERLALIPVELVTSMRLVAVISLCMTTLGWLLVDSAAGIMVAAAYLGAMLTGVIAGPLLLPWLPGRSFAVKGAASGLVWSIAWYLLAGGSGWGRAATIAAFLALPAVSAYYTLNFTGCSPYTSRSGVKREMRLSMPAMGGAIAISALLLVAGRLL